MRFKNWRKPKIREKKLSKYYWLVQYVKNFKMGKFTDIGAFTYINAKYGVILGDNVQIGSHCSIYSVSTIDSKSGKVVLKNNSKLGSHSVVMPGITIGKNAIVGALSFVNRDIPTNEVWGGSPIRKIK